MRAVVLMLLLTACGGGDDDSAPPPDAHPDSQFLPDGGPPDMGAFRFAWTITQGGAAATCADVGADTVRAESASLTTPDVYPDAFPCDDGTGLTGILPVDDYEITIGLYHGGTPLQDHAPIMATVEQVGEIVDLGTIPFAL